MVNRFTGELIADFCHEDGALDWERLLRSSSGRDGLRLAKLREVANSRTTRT